MPRKNEEVPERKQLKFSVHEADNGEFYWLMKGANGETLAMSETYTRKADAQKAVDKVEHHLLEKGGTIQTEERDGKLVATKEAIDTLEAEHKGQDKNEPSPDRPNSRPA